MKPGAAGTGASALKAGKSGNAVGRVKATDARALPSKGPINAVTANCPDVLRISKQEGKSAAFQLAEAAMNPVATNAHVAQRFASQGGPSVIGITEAMHVIEAAPARVRANDLSDLESMLTGQAIALNVMFNEFARRASQNMGTHLEATETYMRLALKTQAQARHTSETLGALKNPPIVYAKQANFAGANQQVINHPTPHTGEGTVSNELGTQDAIDMDARTAGKTRGFDLAVAALGEVNGTTDGGREAHIQPERVPWRKDATGAGT